MFRKNEKRRPKFVKCVFKVIMQIATNMTNDVRLVKTDFNKVVY